MKKAESRKPKGYVLISVIVIMAVLISMMFFFADALFSEQAITQNQKSATTCFHLAEAGVQEAVWRIQNDSTTRNTFLNTTNGITNFSHNNALLTNGSYEVSIQNTAKGAATISVTGQYQTGIKLAKRRITLNVIQANDANPYEYDAAIMVGGPNPGNIYIHNMNMTFGEDYDRAGIYGGANIDIGNANVSVTKDILANGTITEKNSNVNLPPPILPDFTGGVKQSNYNPDFVLPGIDVSSSSSTSYKSQAQAENHYYTSSEFATLLNSQTTFTGIIYVAGTGGITIKNKNVTINGLLVSEGSVSITNATFSINHSDGPSGLITLGNFNVNNAQIDIEGLVYVGVQSSSSNNANVSITGAILAHDFYGNNANLTLNFKKDWVNEVIAGGSTETPVIQMQHWEEEY